MMALATMTLDLITAYVMWDTPEQHAILSVPQENTELIVPPSVNAQ